MMSKHVKKTTVIVDKSPNEVGIHIKLIINMSIKSGGSLSLKILFIEALF